MTETKKHVQPTELIKLAGLDRTPEEIAQAYVTRANSLFWRLARNRKRVLIRQGLLSKPAAITTYVVSWSVYALIAFGLISATLAGWFSLFFGAALLIGISGAVFGGILIGKFFRRVNPNQDNADACILVTIVLGALVGALVVLLKTWWLSFGASIYTDIAFPILCAVSSAIATIAVLAHESDKPFLRYFAVGVYRSFLLFPFMPLLRGLDAWVVRHQDHPCLKIPIEAESDIRFLPPGNPPYRVRLKRATQR